MQPPTRAAGAGAFPEDPVLVRVWRGPHVESQHRGAWVLVDPAGAVVDGAGDFEAAFWVRSAVKSMQALPLVERGVLERRGLGDDALALALASHEAEPQHLAVVERMLAAAGCGVGDLRCGAQAPGSAETRERLRARGERPSALHNNCSGKHAGFLLLARDLGAEPAGYLDPDGPTQTLARRAVLETCGLDEPDVPLAVDGCSAPTFRLPLRALATGFARIANPDALPPARAAAFRRMQRAVAAHPELIAGREGRVCTALARAGGGRLFPKIGAEAVYGLGLVDGGLGLAVKIDDGGRRALHALLVALLERLGWLAGAALEGLVEYAGTPLRNWAGLEVGRTEVLL